MIARKTIYIAIVFCSLFFKQAILHSQEVDDSTFVFNPIIDDITKRIPPLETLIDSAIANSPYLKNRNNMVTKMQYEFKSAQRKILNSMSVSGSMNYGRNSFSTLSDIVSVIESSTQDNFVYNVGLSVRLSIFDIANRRNELNIARKEIEESINSLEEKVFEIKKEVTFQYNDLILKQKLLKIASDNMLTSQMRMVMIEQKFLNNEIALEELSRIMEWHSDAQIAYETAAIELMNAYILLELTCGLKFNLMNKID
ncbi:MAG: hypothetical protein A2X11_02525 [Bacteroidetes bacterium GWE2_42_24]|nr:MAG: hypothetical protein A2X11_02525 [Bacteroidetes bacterium GWE2_42_24]OFY32300.1 MAG: hypothetical protein A2X09_11735 [Bacteroidetes bacterium GWF2_43_11]PKP24284.1 MAG: hypothetical protein CVU06_05100 [Bacteroidetes bacterium HGW-Bacteroidetes-22]